LVAARRIAELSSVTTGGTTHKEWLRKLEKIAAEPDRAARRTDTGAAAEEAPADTGDVPDVDLGPLRLAAFGGADSCVDLDGADTGGPSSTTDLPTASDSGQTSSGGSSSKADSPSRRFTPWVLAAFGAATALATVVTLVITLANSPSTESSAAPTVATAPVRVVEVAPPSPPPNLDGPLPFTASSDCAPGSTSAQSVADPNSTTAWVCLRSVDGQVLEIDLGRAFVITAVSIVPGAVNKTDTNPDQPDPWLQHRVVSRVAWHFNDTDRTVKNQTTGNVRGEAVEAIRPGVLASKVTLIIQETSRPPAIAPTGSPPPPGVGPSILGDILGGNQDTTPALVPAFPGAKPPRDPADGTFAVSSIKIIGHKAV